MRAQPATHRRLLADGDSQRRTAGVKRLLVPAACSVGTPRSRRRRPVALRVSAADPRLVVDICGRECPRLLFEQFRSGRSIARKPWRQIWERRSTRLGLSKARARSARNRGALWIARICIYARRAGRGTNGPRPQSRTVRAGDGCHRLLTAIFRKLTCSQQLLGSASTGASMLDAPSNRSSAKLDRSGALDTVVIDGCASAMLLPRGRPLGNVRCAISAA